MTQVEIIIPSVDKFADCWPGLVHGLTKYWPDCPYAIHLLSEFNDSPSPNISVMKLGAETNWSQRLLAALTRGSSTYVLLLLEDYWLMRPVDSARLRSYVKLMDRHDLHYLRLLAHPEPDHDFPPDPRLGVIDREGDYRTSTQAALWRRETLRELLVPGESIWQFELAGTDRSRRYGDTFLSVKAHNGDRHYWGMYYTCTAVNRGRWSRVARRYADREGVAIDFTTRPWETWWDDFKRSGWMGGAVEILEHRIRMLVTRPMEFARKCRRRLVRL